MQFIEMNGETLLKIITEGEVDLDALRTAGVSESSIIRVNLQGDIELRRRHGWDVVGGLLGGFDERIRQATGLNWA